MSPTAVMRAFEGDGQPAETLQATSAVTCTGGFADGFPCHNLDLAALMPLSDLGAGSANDIWGWTSEDGREFALIGLNNGTGFVEITAPSDPVYIGKLPTHTVNSAWRDIKVYMGHAYIVSEAAGHGMQVFDLTKLLNAKSDYFPITYGQSDYVQYSAFGDAHNIAINEGSGFAYVVGSNSCSGGLHVIDITTPAEPSVPGGGTGPVCFADDGYTHDVQCVVYHGLDPEHDGREICFAANQDTLTIVDLTDPLKPIELSRTGYDQSGYTHQVWLDEGHEYLFLNDESDETSFNIDTLTRVWDVADLKNPIILDLYSNVGVAAIDHNLYVHGDFVYQANYRSGLRVLEIVRDSSGGYSFLQEIASFDVYPASDAANYNGAWGNYPYFLNGTVVVSGIEQGLFVLTLKLQDEVSFAAPSDGAMVFGEFVGIDIFARDRELDAVLLPTVEWMVDGGAWKEAAHQGNDFYGAKWFLERVGDGQHRLTARMNVTTDSIQVVVNNLPPSASFIDPPSGTVSGRLTLRASSDDDGTVVSVTFFSTTASGTTEIGTDTNGSDGWSTNWNTRKAEKTDHTLTVVATDNRDQVSSPEGNVVVTVGGKSGGSPGGGGKPDGGDKCFKNKAPLCES